MRSRCNDVYSKSDNVGFCVLDMKLNWVGDFFYLDMITMLSSVSSSHKLCHPWEYVYWRFNKVYVSLKHFPQKYIFKTYFLNN